MNKQKLVNDVEYLLKNLPELHNDLFSLISKEEYINIGKSIIKTIHKRDFKVETFKLLLLTLFSKIKDPHTTIYLNNITPIHFEWINGNYYPFVVNIENREFLLKKLLKINGVPLEKYFEKIQKYLVFDNDELLKVEYAKSLSNVDFIKQVTKNDSEDIEYTFEDNEKIILDKTQRQGKVDQTSIYWIKGNKYLSMKNLYYLEKYNQALYFRFASCREDPNYPIKKLLEDVKNILNSNPQRIIIDLRNNQGGDSDVILPVLDQFEKYINDKPNKKVFTLINRRTFSSGVYDILEIERRMKTVLVGQPTGQGMNHFGCVKLFRLPNTKVEIHYSSKYYKFYNNDLHIVPPDVYIEPELEDYKQGNDIVLNYCLEQ